MTTAGRAATETTPPSVTGGGSSYALLPPLSEEERRTGERQLAFALDFQSILQQHALSSPSESYVYSPLALGAALELAYEGAQGATRAEIGRLLRLDSDNASKEGMGFGLLESTTTPPPFGVFKLVRANVLWHASGYELLPTYTARIRSRVGADLIAGRPDVAPEPDINEWVAKATNGRINELLARDTLRSDTRFVIANALNVEATWLAPFPPEKTRNRPFTTIEGKKIQLPTMLAKGNRAVSFGDDYDAVDLVLSDPEHRLLFIAPHQGRFDAVQAAVPELVPRIMASVAPQYIQVELPRFRIDHRLFLREALRAAGMELSLSRHADFANMTSSKVFLDQVIQGASFEIDESGVRATAATALAFPPPSLPPKPRLVRFDRPFIFFLHNLRTKAVLFSGRFTGPARSRD